MATTNVTFTAQTGAGLRTLVTVKKVPGGAKHTLSFGSGPETLSLDTGAAYVVVADLVGSVGDTLSLTWKRGSGAAKPLLTARELKRQEELETKRAEFTQSFCIGSGGIFGWPNDKLTRHGLSAAEIKAIRDEQKAWRNRDISVVNITGSVGYGRFAFHDPTSFAETKDNKTSYALSFSAGIHPSRDAPFFGAGYEYKREYKAQDKRVICPAGSGGAANTNCRFEIFDAPKRDISHNLFALIRYADWDKDKATRMPIPMAVELRAGFDIEDRIFGISIPAYFFLDDKKQFRGGAKFSWAEATGFPPG